MGDDIVVEELDEALAGEGGGIDFMGMIGTEEGEGGLADDAVRRLRGNMFEADVGFSDGRPKGREDIGDDGVGAGLADKGGGRAGCFPAEVGGPEAGVELG